MTPREALLHRIPYHGDFAPRGRVLGIEVYMALSLLIERFEPDGARRLELP